MIEALHTRSEVPPARLAGRLYLGHHRRHLLASCYDPAVLGPVRLQKSSPSAAWSISSCGFLLQDIPC